MINLAISNLENTSIDRILIIPNRSESSCKFNVVRHENFKFIRRLFEATMALIMLYVCIDFPLRYFPLRYFPLRYCELIYDSNKNDLK
ncbi:hypothetical protein H8356DRAFT_1350224 [Neocallimastix lanati (nom. inval.)]|nr:hypothetical protein H8356DRAFT_1350224 [Neocallimastix sp. JGI-2020a]